MMVHNMVYWSSRQFEKLNDISTVVGSGKQVNKPSDDPTGTRQILADRATLSTYDQYEYNIELAQTWISVSDTTLTSVYSLLQDVQDAVSADISSGSDDAETTAMTLQGIYDQILSMADQLYGSEYMYSGNLSDTRPFYNEVSISGGTADNILFNLASAASSVTIEISDENGNVVRTLTAAGGTEGTNTVSWDGLDDGGTALANGDYTFTVTATDSGGASVASYAAYRGDTGNKEFNIGKDSSISLINNGDTLFGSTLKVLSQIITALQDTSTTDVSTGDFADALAGALSDIENQEVLLSNAGTLMTNASDRLASNIVAIENKISEIEVGDTNTAAAKLTAQETAYEVSQNALASILKMSKLSDYL